MRFEKPKNPLKKGVPLMSLALTFQKDLAGPMTPMSVTLG